MESNFTSVLRSVSHYSTYPAFTKPNYRISPSTSRFKNKSKSNFLGENVSKIVGSTISRTRNSEKIRDPNDAKFHRSAHYTVESLVPQSTISPDMLVKDPKL